jgi:Tol biopolymer transport system component
MNSVTVFVLRAILRLGVIGVLLIALALLVAPSLPDEGQLMVGVLSEGQWLFFLVDAARPMTHYLPLFRPLPSWGSPEFQWSPNGKHLVFRSETNDLSIVDLDTYQISDFAPSVARGSGCCLSWLPDSETIIMVHGNADGFGIYAVETAEFTERLLHSVNGNIDNRNYGFPYVSPDGQQIAFPLEWKLYIIDVTNGDVQIFDEIRFPLCCYQWSPNSQDIAFISSSSESDPIYILDTLTRTITVFDRVGNRFNWAWDSRHMAIWNNQFGSIYILDVAKNELYPLNEDNFWETFPVWSPNRDRFVFASSRGCNGDSRTSLSVYISSVNGLEQDCIIDTDLDAIGPVLWSHDGTQIAFLSSSGSTMKIFIVNTDGTNLRNLQFNHSVVPISVLSWWP